MDSMLFIEVCCEQDKMQGAAPIYKEQFPSCSGGWKMDGIMTQSLPRGSFQVKQQWPEPKGVDEVVFSGLLLPILFTS